MHALITRLWREHGLTIIMVTHDIKEAFSLGTRVLTLDKRRHDPHAPHRYGAGVVYDLELTRKLEAASGGEGEDGGAEPVLAAGGITIDTIGNN
jgi:NitT/TauT family transport system ATP-binding protein